MNAGRIAALAGLVFVALWVTTYRVAEGEVVIVSRFGDPRAPVTAAGLHFRWPPPIDGLTRLDARVHVLDTEPSEFLTRDKKNVTVDAFLAWRVGDPLKFVRGVPVREDAEDRLVELALGVLGEVLAERDLESLLGPVADSAEGAERPPGGLAAADAALTERTRAAAEREFGIEILTARVRRLSFPRQNKAAVFLRMEADRQAIASAYRAEGSEEYEKITAAAEREAAELISAAEEEAARIRAEADAEVTRITTEAYARDPELFRFLRSLETLEAALDEESTVVLPADHPLLRVLSEVPAGDDAPGGDE